MNNKTKVLSVFLLILVISCKSDKTTITTYNSDEHVIIRINKKFKKIFRVNIPIKIKVKNNSIEKKSFIKIDYEYNPYSKGIGEDVYRLQGEESIKIKNNEKKTIAPYNCIDYLIYSWFRLDTLEVTQKEFKLYIEKMLVEKKDTLHIGTVKEFKIKHKELFEKLTNNDSISIQFLDDDKLGERITVPVKW
ncbi:hypothetical protein A8C32_03955 [Flavivirga aquatica]|uniref:Uncharacterized protein n=1 Tax=Flavivirga aquatica TaxID=1849968 RepID=A0A1E5TB52_9FLAO|nr:hypothetical protein [Flavivirga aquatica]OEK08612.1 hypothetical protein A8C32_03955 [Flavivirga aquatica]